ncbi:hypothetical protein WDW37_15030 [Bdellovibrionota bacterium FG-1]
MLPVQPPSKKLQRWLYLLAAFALLASYLGVKAPSVQNARIEKGTPDEVISLLKSNSRSSGKNSAQLKLQLNQIAASTLLDPQWAHSPKINDLFEWILAKGLANEVLATRVLTQPEWAKKPQAVEWAQKIIHDGGAGAWSMVQSTLAQDVWVNDRGMEVARFVIGRRSDYTSPSSQYFDKTLLKTLKSKAWQKHPELILPLAERLILSAIASPSEILGLLKLPSTAPHPLVIELFRAYSEFLIDPSDGDAVGIMTGPKSGLLQRVLHWFRVSTVTEFAWY